MGIRIYCGFLQRTGFLYSAAAANILSSSSYYSTTSKVNRAANKSFRSTKELSFEEFKKAKVKSFEEYKKSPAVEQLLKNDPQKLAKAYEAYCRCQFTHYRIEQQGGNPLTMT